MLAPAVPAVACSLLAAGQELNGDAAPAAHQLLQELRAHTEQPSITKNDLISLWSESFATVIQLPGPMHISAVVTSRSCSDRSSSDSSRVSAAGVHRVLFGRGERYNYRSLQTMPEWQPATAALSTAAALSIAAASAQSTSSKLVPFDTCTGCCMTCRRTNDSAVGVRIALHLLSDRALEPLGDFDFIGPGQRERSRGVLLHVLLIPHCHQGRLGR